MKARLMGLQIINFTNGDGEAINGKNIFVAFKDDNVEGYRTDKFFLKESIVLPKDLKLNEEVELAFNHRGKIESISK